MLSFEYHVSTPQPSSSPMISCSTKSLSWVEWLRKTLGMTWTPVACTKKVCHRIITLQQLREQGRDPVARRAAARCWGPGKPAAGFSHATEEGKNAWHRASSLTKRGVEFNGC